MPEPNLAFLQNFYTDVTLYMPAEPERAPVAEPVNSVAPGEPAPVGVVPSVPAPPVVPAVPLPVAAAAAAPLPPPAVLRPAPAAVAPSVTPATPQPVPAVPPVMLVTFATQGSNANGVVLLVRLPHERFMKLSRNVFLNKMLQALGLVMADVVLVNVESHLPVALASLRRELAATQIIAFGKNLLDVTIRNTQIYEPVQFPGLDLSFLASAEIELIEYDVSLKKRLWVGLQRMFLR